MTPKEKAENLIWKYLTSRDVDGHNDVRDVHAAIRCALIAVDELLNYGNLYNNHNYPKDVKIEETIYYWIAVKQEIEEL